MNFHWQNLKDDNPRAWLHGRCWLHRSGDYHRTRFSPIRAEWSIPMGSCGWGITFGDEEDRGIQVQFTIPFLLTIYLTICNVWRDSFLKYVTMDEARATGGWASVDSGDDREIALSFHDGAIWWHFWVGTMASWSRSYPWCKWWRQGSFHFADLLGKQKYTNAVVQDRIPAVVEMPEGRYRGWAKVERATWKRPLWLARERVSTWIDVPGGIPHSGKGENSYDCGDDGVWGCGVTGDDVTAAESHFREVVLKNRARYGDASPDGYAFSRAKQAELAAELGVTA